ncbi:Hypothetical predicted protein [Podarcis lilfordi]|uniref:Uncharacterized protein n=1 Tax=Podarcis lilfordi TaxID=74358 RepID=A0AA35LCR9_9SAUR|nr:Hypothetical predicted protein [Podarcis lilfordi]
MAARRRTGPAVSDGCRRRREEPEATPSSGRRGRGRRSREPIPRLLLLLPLLPRRR